MSKTDAPRHLMEFAISHGTCCPICEKPFQVGEPVYQGRDEFDRIVHIHFDCAQRAVAAGEAHFISKIWQA